MIPSDRAIALAGLLLYLPVFALLVLRLQKGQDVSLRSIPGMDLLAQIMERALEEGRRLHVSPGVGGIGDTTTVETMAGIATLDALMAKSTAAGVEPLVSVADATVLPLVQDVLRNLDTSAHSPQSGWNAMYDARFMGPDVIAYAAGTMEILQHESITGNVMIGEFGPEFLLMGEAGSQTGMVQIAGTANLRGLPYMQLGADHTLIGEEVFATGAFLSRWPAHLASLVMEDITRWLIVVVILIGVTLHTILG